MRTTEQLRKDFALYIEEIERCNRAKCYWALLHVLLALPDVCASVEGQPQGRKRYVDWCGAYLPNSPVSASERYQMRNALLHAGSTTPQNTSFVSFSYLQPDQFQISVHNTTNATGTILNIHPAAMAEETKQALDRWFDALQNDPLKMSRVEQNILCLARIQPKIIRLTGMDGSVVEEIGLTHSST